MSVSIFNSNVEQPIAEQANTPPVYFSVKMKKDFAEVLEEKFNALLKISRDNYIKVFAFDKYHPPRVTEEQISRAFITKPQQLQSLAKKAQRSQTDYAFIQYLQHSIEKIYDQSNSKDFAAQVYYYFQNKPDLIGLFAYFAFPGIYGYFLRAEQEMCAYDFLNSLLTLSVENNEFEFFITFFVSYLMSSHEFINIFWHKFFAFIRTERRYHLSLAQIYDYFLQALQESANYLTVNQTMLVFTFISNNFAAFCEGFFNRFLLTTFSSFIYYNPTLTSNAITEKDIRTLFSYISEDINSKCKQDIEQAFANAPLSRITPISVLRSHVVLKCHISPCECKLLLDFFNDYPTTKNICLYGSDFFEDKLDFTLFAGGNANLYPSQSFELQFPPFLFPSNYTSEMNSLTTELKSCKSEEPQWIAIKQICQENYVDPFVMVDTCNQDSPDDTIFVRKTKNLIRNKVTPQLKEYVKKLLKKETLAHKVEADVYFGQMHVLKNFDEIESKLANLGEIFEQLFLVKIKGSYDTLLGKSLFVTDIIRYQMIEDQMNPHIKECQINFNKALVNHKYHIPKLQVFYDEKKEFFQPLICEFSCLDSMSPGDRFFILYCGYKQINILAKSNKEGEATKALQHALFARVIVESKFKSFLRTFLSIFAFQKNNNRKFSQLPKDILKVWVEIQSFVDTLINDSSFDKASANFIVDFMNKI